MFDIVKSGIGSFNRLLGDEDEDPPAPPTLRLKHVERSGGSPAIFPPSEWDHLSVGGRRRDRVGLIHCD